MNIWLLTPLLGTLLYFRKPIINYTTFIYGLVTVTCGQILKEYRSSTEIVGDSIMIKYNHNGVPYELLVPYKIQLILQHSNHNMYIGNRLIKHQPGIPYFVCPEDVEVDTIKIIDKSTEEEFLFKDDTIPFQEIPYDCE